MPFPMGVIANTAGAGVLCIACAPSPVASREVPQDATVPRRVLWIDVDDVGRDLLEASPTPSLDRLRREGLEFTHHWASPKCSPFRARVMTGLDSYRPGNWVGHVVRSVDSYSLPTDQLLLPSPPVGRSSHRGKWHLAKVTNYRHPILCGFDEWSGPMGNPEGDFYRWEKVTANRDTFSVATSEVYATVETADDVLADLREGFDFIHASFPDVHKPMQLPPRELWSQPAPAPGDRQGVRRVKMEALDTLLGRVVDEALRRGYYVFVTSDNGSSDMKQETGEGKGTMRESGISTFLLVLGPGVPRGRTDRLVQATDHMVTIRTILGAPTDDPPVDSKSYADELGDFPGAPPRETVTSDWYRSRLGRPPLPELWERAIRDARWKLVRLWDEDAQGFRDYLFDLENDPDEATPLDPDADPEVRRAYEYLWERLPKTEDGR